MEYTNMPKRLSRSDYEACVDLVVQEAAHNPTISSVYLMGGEWCPGISDLDIVVIYKQGVPPMPLRNPWSLSEEASFIFTHRHLSFDQDSAAYLYFLYPKETAQLRLLVGVEQQFREVPDDIQPWTLAFILFDILVNKLLLLGRNNTGPVNVRQSIGELYSLVYTIWMVREMGGTDIDEGFGEKIRALRRDWFTLNEHPRLETLEALRLEGMQLVSRAVNELNAFVSRNAPEARYNGLFSNSLFSVRFADQWSYERYQEEFSRSFIWRSKVFGKNIFSFRVLLPSSFVLFFEAYAAGEGAFSALIRQNLSPMSTSRVLPPLAAHVEAVNKAYEASFRSGGIFKIPYTYGFSPRTRDVRSTLFWKGISFLRDL